MSAARTGTTPSHQRFPWRGFALALLATGAITGCSNSGKGDGQPAAATQVAAAAGASNGSAAVQAATPTVSAAVAQAKAAAPVPSGPAQQNLRLIKSTPDNGPIGTAFTVTADGLTAGKTATLMWAT